jgi:hypothetical protein
MQETLGSKIPFWCKKEKNYGQKELAVICLFYNPYLLFDKLYEIAYTSF